MPRQRSAPLVEGEPRWVSAGEVGGVVQGATPAVPAPGARHRVIRRALVGGVVLAAAAASAVALTVVAQRDAWLQSHPRVPNLVGRTIAEAAQMVVPLHFGVIVAGHGEDPNVPIGAILVQDPPAGRPLLKRSIIRLTVNQGSGVVPALRNLRVNAAAERLERVGLRLGRVNYLNDDAASGTVLEQFTPPGRQLGANSPVDVLVSLGPAAPPTAASAPLAAPPIGPLDSGSSLPLPTLTDQKGCCRAGSAAVDRPTHPERERAEVHREPADDRGAQPDVHGPEHRNVPSGP